MKIKAQLERDFELAIGLIFIVVIGVAIFMLTTKNSIPGVQQDPQVKVKDSNIEPSAIDLEEESADSIDSSLGANFLGNENSLQDVVIQNTEQLKFNTPPKMSIDSELGYQADIRTSKGDLKVRLFADKTPITVNNFVFLANQGFYNSTRSHRILKGFMVQFGDPLTKDLSQKSYWGTGGPGYKFDDESFSGSYKRGTVAMANSGPDTNGSQFFIMHNDSSLPPNYVIFGELADSESLSVLDAIANTPVTKSRSGEPSLPTQDVFINSVEISQVVSVG